MKAVADEADVAASADDSWPSDPRHRAQAGECERSSGSETAVLAVVGATREDYWTRRCRLKGTEGIAVHTAT